MDLEKIAEAILKNASIQNVHFNDIHDNEHVYVGADGATAEAKPVKDDVARDAINQDEELFHFIYPGIADEEARVIHVQVKDLVGRFAIKDICKFLKCLVDEKKILLPQNPENAFNELHRMGLPPAETKGFGYDNFCKYYKEIK